MKPDIKQLEEALLNAGEGMTTPTVCPVCHGDNVLCRYKRRPSSKAIRTALEARITALETTLLEYVERDQRNREFTAMDDPRVGGHVKPSALEERARKLLGKT